MCSHTGSKKTFTLQIVVEYKYLRVSIDNRVNWKANINGVYKKGMS